MSQYDATHVTTLSVHWQREPSNTSAMPSWSHAASHQSFSSKILTGKYCLQLTGSMSSCSTVCVCFVYYFIVQQLSLYRLQCEDKLNSILCREAVIKSLHCYIDKLWLWDCDSTMLYSFQHPIYQAWDTRESAKGGACKSTSCWQCAIITKWVGFLHTTITESEYVLAFVWILKENESHSHTARKLLFFFFFFLQRNSVLMFVMTTVKTEGGCELYTDINDWRVELHAA